MPISVGAPFALACAVRWPQRVGALLLSSPMCPWEWPETRAGMSRRNRRYFTLAARAPVLSRAACWLWARMALAGLGGDRDRLLARLSRGCHRRTGGAGRGGRRPATVAMVPGRQRRGVPPGSAGVAADLAVASRPWGFQLGGVTVPTWLWHGTADQDVPVAAARRMAQAIPTCRATFTDEGHLMGLRHADEAIEAIRTATGA